MPTVRSQIEQFPIGAEWHYEIGDMQPPYGKYHHSVVKKDTVVAGKTCRLVVANNGKQEIVYEDSGRVYYHFKDKFRKIYDFNVEEGDTVEIEYKTRSEIFPYELDSTLILPFVVKKVSTKNINDIQLKKISAYNGYYESNNHEYWRYEHVYIEKVGIENLDLFEVEVIFPVCPGCPVILEHYTQLRCYNNSDIDYTTDWWVNAGQGKPCDYKFDVSNTVEKKTQIKFTPNPIKDELTISGKYSQKVTIVIYDATGQIVLNMHENLPCKMNLQHLVSGIYYIRIFDNKTYLISEKIIKL